MLSLHQLRCFLATVEHGSLTAAAEHLGYSQPSISEQIRALERSVEVALFVRVGRGVVLTEAGHALRPHAERTLAAAKAAREAMQSVTALETGTIRFGIFGAVRWYAGAAIVADVLERHPGVRVELVGTNSTEVQDDLRRGHLEAALIAVPQITTDGLVVTPVARSELVYISADPERLQRPVNAKAIAHASLVMPDSTYRDEDSTRVIVRRMLHEAGLTATTRIEVEDVETAVELVGMGLADSITHRAIAEQLLPRLAPHAGFVPLRPRLYDPLAVVHRVGAELSPAARLMIDLATRRIRELTDPL